MYVGPIVDYSWVCHLCILLRSLKGVLVLKHALKSNKERRDSPSTPSHWLWSTISDLAQTEILLRFGFSVSQSLWQVGQRMNVGKDLTGPEIIMSLPAVYRSLSYFTIIHYLY